MNFSHMTIHNIHCCCLLLHSSCNKLPLRQVLRLRVDIADFDLRQFLSSSLAWAPQKKITSIWVFPKIVVPQNGWFIMENLIKMDDLGVPLFLETPIFLNTNTFKRGAKWFCYRVSIHHPLGFNWHPFEGAGTYCVCVELCRSLSIL